VGSGRIDCGAMVEIVIGEAADDWTDAEALDAWRAVLALSASL
jgi:hypothetical protein